MESLSSLGASIDVAIEQGNIEDASGPGTSFVSASKLRTAYRYLFLLGYLSQLPPEKPSTSSTKQAKIKKSIEAAVKLFQAECHLQQDGQITEYLWSKLLQLCSFDTPIYTKQWMHNSLPLRALTRAAHVRLYAFGLAKRLPRTATGIASKDKELRQDFQHAINGFVRASVLLKLSDAPLSADQLIQTLDSLFNQQELIRRLSYGGKGIHLYQPVEDTDRQKKNNRHFVKDFVNHVARVELWLFGYNVTLGSGKDKERTRLNKSSMSFLTALKEFRHTYDETEEEKSVKQGDICGLQFARMLSLAQQQDDDEQSLDVVEKTLSDQNVRSGVMSRLKNLGARLWDGAKRLFKSVKAFFKKVKHTLKVIVLNISRYIHKAANRVFGRVKAAIQGVADGINFLKEKTLRGSNPEQMLMTHDKDFDFVVFVHARASAAKVANLSSRLIIRSELFQTSTKVVSELLTLFIRITRHGVTGWLAVLLALTRLRKTFINFDRYTKRQQNLVAELASLQTLTL